MQRIERLFGRGERARRTARQHPVGLVRSLGRRLFQLALVIVAARLIGSQTVADWLSLEFLATLPIAATAQAIPGWIGTLLFWVGAILVGLALFDGLRWYQTRFILTDQRLLQQRGVIGLLVVDTPLDRIDEIVLGQSILGEKLDYGTLLVKAGSADGALPLDDIESPVAFRRELEARRQARHGLESHRSEPRRPAAPASASA